MAVRGYCQEIAERRWNESGELLFGEELWTLLEKFLSGP